MKCQLLEASGSSPQTFRLEFNVCHHYEGGKWILAPSHSLSCVKLLCCLQACLSQKSSFLTVQIFLMLKHSLNLSSNLIILVFSLYLSPHLCWAMYGYNRIMINFFARINREAFFPVYLLYLPRIEECSLAKWMNLKWWITMNLTRLWRERTGLFWWLLGQTLWMAPLWHGWFVNLYRTYFTWHLSWLTSSNGIRILR